MHELELFAMWFSSVISGVLLTMLLPKMVSSPTRSGCIDDSGNEQLAQDEINEQSEAVVSIQNAPDVYVVSTSWAWGLPRAASEPATRNPEQVRRIVPLSAQRAYVAGMERKEVGRRGDESAGVRRELAMIHE